ncbi:MAG: 1-phosphofructokinase, partial [Lachnospiraceae bacterium]|nr:1-phosphofructokinase [Lachnospiraceae bacterium]
GRALPTREDLIEEAKKLLKKGIQKVVVSLGSEGMLYVDGEGTLFAPAKEVQVVSTVGCGDTAVASLCMNELAGDDREMALRKAVALSAANAATEGCGQIPMELYLELL